MIARRALLSLALIFAATAAAAQSYPTRVIRIVVPAGPGGPTDVFARIVAQRLSLSPGREVIVENRTGAGGAIAAKAVATAAPDGYTLLLGNTSTLAVIPSFAKNPDYDPEKYFTAVAILADSFQILSVRADSPVNSVRELVALAKASPTKLDFGSAGHGNLTHLAAELFKTSAGIELVHVPYKSVAEATNALLAGQVHLAFGNPNVMLPHIQSGRFRALAVTSATRSPDLPNVPTMMEAGIERYAVTSFFGLVAPAGTDATIVAKLNGAINEILKLPDVHANFVRLGADPRTATAGEFAAMIAEENRKWTAVAKTSGLKIE
jgi:tripartite-type tricarboxylate transporter receptor subunit TctC